MPCLYPHLVRFPDGHVVNMAIGHLNDVLPCEDCNSLGCSMSPCYVPVQKWRCYQKKFENKI